MDISRKDVNIQVIRVVSMFLIILTHLIREVESVQFLAQVSNSAIFTFLFISGYLLGRKEIKSPKKWVFNRIIKIMIPAYIFMIFLFSMRFLMFGEINLSAMVIYLFNIQGLLGHVNGATHFWFLTTMMFCYLITPILKKVSEYSLLKIISFFIGLSFIQVIATFLISQNVGQNIFYVLIYSLAYFISSRGLRKTSTKQFIFLSILTVLFLFIRLFSKSMIDETLLYGVFVVSISQSMLGIYIFLFLDKFNFSKANTKFKEVINHFDKISFEMFIVHYSFIKGPFFIWGLTSNIIIDSLLVLIATYVSATILKKLSTNTSNKINLLINNKQKSIT